MSLYITLPSNSSMKYFPDNTVTNYTTKLARPIELNGLWEVALVEIVYPHTWENVQRGGNKLWIDCGSGMYHGIAIPRIQYVSVEHFIEELQKTCSAECGNSVTITYNPTSKRISFALQDKARVSISGRLARQLGFNSENITIKSNMECPNPVNLNWGLDTLYIYCNIVDSQLVGDTLAPLLRAINIQGAPGDTVYKSFNYPHYLPLTRLHIDTIEIDIRDDTGEKVPFVNGKVIVKLHFRQRKSPYFQ